MWIRANTQLGEHCVLVASAATSHIVTGGEVAAVVDAGLSVDADRLIAGINAVLDGLSLENLFLTHVSFDHVGGLPYLRRAFPNLSVLGSPASAVLLEDLAVLRELYDRNQQCAEAMDSPLGETFDEWASAIKIDHIVRDGDAVNLGEGVEVKIIATPGYSADAHAYFILPDGALAAGHAVGDFGGRDKLYFAFKHSSADYLASLDKLSNLELKIVGLPHTGAISGDLANRSLFGVREQVLKFQAQVRERLANGELVDDIYGALYAEWLELGIVPDGPFAENSKSTLRKMIELVAEGK